LDAGAAQGVRRKRKLASVIGVENTETSGRPVWPRSPVHMKTITGVECNGCHLL
jgi:hypothetical protein